MRMELGAIREALHPANGKGQGPGAIERVAAIVQGD